MSVKCLSAILGPEMAAPILWTPGKNAFFLQEKPVSIKFLVLGGGGGIWGFFGGGGPPGCRFYFYGREDFSDFWLSGPVRDTSPYRAIPFRDSIAEGGIAPICLVFIGYRTSIAEIPLLRGGGGIAPPLRMLSKGETLRKGGGRIAPNGPC